MPAPRLRLGTVEFEVPYMHAGILGECHAEIVAWLAIDQLLLSPEQVSAVVTLTHALARRAKITLTKEEVAEAIDTKNLGEVLTAIGFAYFAPSDKDKANGAPPGEAEGPWTSTGTVSPGT